MQWISSSVPIPKKFRPERVVIGPARCCSDGERYFLKDGGLEDALGPEKRYTPAVQHESLGQRFPRKNVTELGDAVGQPIEGRTSHSRIV